MVRTTSTRTRTPTFEMFWFVAWLSLVISVSALESDDSKKSCERLKATLSYTQEDAPRDLSSVLPVVVEKINRVLDGVVDVEVEWTGAELHGQVGEHMIETTVTRLVGSDTSISSSPSDVRKDEFGRDVASRCFHVPIHILDTNECLLPPKHSMRHKCHDSSVCVNTDGSYECACPRLAGAKEGDSLSPWELSFSSSAKTSCPSSPSTEGCCPASSQSAEGKRCRERFRCPIDPCDDAKGTFADGTKSNKTHDCAPTATCIRAESPNLYASLSKKEEGSVPGSSSLSSNQLYTCECPEGLMGNGKSCRPGIDPPPQPMVMFDGVTPTALTLRNNFYCGCTKPKIDACSGFPPCQGKHEVCTVKNNEPMCACRPGYVHHETYGCVDENPPTLKLRNDPRGDQILRLKQGDEYREHMVDIVDDNAEDYLRSLKITYSQPLPPGCLTNVGEFHVNYTVAMPWANPPYMRITRRVIIEDIDESKIMSNPKLLKRLQKTCPQLLPQCDIEAGAECRNTVGSYSCQCPPRTSGDGFLRTAKFDDPDVSKPTSFKGGTSCVDTSKPVIKVQGPNPKIFRVAKAGGLTGVMSPYSGSRGSRQLEDAKDDLVAAQQALYEPDIREMIRATAGAELCATHEKPRVNPSDCIEATDFQYKGKVDLSRRVTVGDPIYKSSLHWVVPYDVQDDAGNKAATVYRDVFVEEVGLNDLEQQIRNELVKGEQHRTKQAVDNAIREEKRKWDAENRNSPNRSRRNGSDSNARSCPACPPCNCPETDVVNAASCAAHCSDMSETCRQLGDDNVGYRLLLWLENVCPVQLPPMIVFSFITVLLLYILQFVWTLLFQSKSYHNYDYGNYNSINDDALLATSNPPEARQQQGVVPSQTTGGTDRIATMRPPSNSLSIATTGILSPNAGAPNGNGGAFFSPGSSNQMRGMGDDRFRNGSLLSPAAATTATPRQDAYDGGPSVYQSPPLIVPSKNGEGGVRRSPYR